MLERGGVLAKDDDGGDREAEDLRRFKAIGGDDPVIRDKSRPLYERVMRFNFYDVDRPEQYLGDKAVTQSQRKRLESLTKTSYLNSEIEAHDIVAKKRLPTSLEDLDNPASQPRDVIIRGIPTELAHDTAELYKDMQTAGQVLFKLGFVFPQVLGLLRVDTGKAVIKPGSEGQSFEHTLEITEGLLNRHRNLSSPFNNTPASRLKKRLEETLAERDVPQETREIVESLCDQIGGASAAAVNYARLQIARARELAKIDKGSAIVYISHVHSRDMDLNAYLAGDPVSRDIRKLVPDKELLLRSYVERDTELYRSLIDRFKVVEDAPRNEGNRNPRDGAKGSTEAHGISGKVERDPMYDAIMGTNGATLSDDTKARIDYFVEEDLSRYELSADQKGILADGFKHLNLHKRTRNRASAPSDRQLRTFFDDVMLSLHEGQVPDTQRLNEMYNIVYNDQSLR